MFWKKGRKKARIVKSSTLSLNPVDIVGELVYL
jgi:hypothetical protein